MQVTTQQENTESEEVANTVRTEDLQVETARNVPTEPPEEEQKSKQTTEGSDDDEDSTPNQKHTPVVIQNVAKTPRIYTDEEKEGLRNSSIAEAMALEAGLESNYDAY